MLLKSRRELLLCLLLSGSACVSVCAAGMHQHRGFSLQRSADPAFSGHDLASNSGADRNTSDENILICPDVTGRWSDSDRLAGGTGSGGLFSALSDAEKLLQLCPERLLAQVRRKVTEQVAAPSAAQISINSQTSLSVPKETTQTANQSVQQFAAPAVGSVVPGQTPSASPAPATTVKLPGGKSRTEASASSAKDDAARPAEVAAADRKADAEAEQKAKADTAKAADAARRAQVALKSEEEAARKKAEEEARQKAEAERKAKAEEEARIATEKKAEEERKAAELAAKKKAEEEKKAAELAARKKAEEEARLKAEAEKKAKAEEAARIAAEKKAEQERKAAELAAKKKAEEEKKAARARAAKAADEGIKLYNAGKYQEALEKFAAALNDDPESQKALSYKPRAEKKLEEKLKKEKEEAERRELENKKKIELAQLKAESPTPTVGLPAPATDKDKKDSQKPLKSLSEVIADTSSDQKSEADKKGSSSSGSGSASSSSSAAEKKDSSGSSSNPAVEADRLVRQAQRELQEGKRSQAVETARKAAQLDPNNVEAKALVAELDSAPSDQGLALPSLNSTNPPPSLSSASKKSSSEARPVSTPALPGKPADVAETVANAGSRRSSSDSGASSGASSQASSLVSQGAEAAFQKGLVAYQSGQLDAAVQQWNYALTLNPTHSGALQYLELTRAEYDAWVQQHQYNAIQLQKEAIGADKLETPITYDTAGQKTISEFLQAMSILTDVNFYVAAGVDPEVRITAKFEDTPLYDALDIVLLPIGLKWSRTGDTVTITPDLRHKYFNLTPEQVARLKPLLENKTIQKYLYGPEGVPAMRNVELLLDPVQNSLIVTDSQENINKLEAFLKDLQIAGPPGLVLKSFKIRPEEGQKIKALVEALVRVQSDAPYDLDRTVAVSGDDLIIKDTPDNIAKIEQLLLDKNFIRKLETQKLNVATFNLTPREPIIENVEQARDLAQNIVTVVKTILYAQSGESAAAAEGRRYFYDPNTLQLTITDYPENLRVVGDYIRSLPMLSGRTQRSDIIFLKHQGAAEMADLLNRVLGLASGPISASAAGGTGDSVTKNLSTEQEITFQGIRVRLLRVNENNVADENDDSAEFVVRTPTTSQDVTLQEYRSQFIEDYELSALQIRPSGTTGRGSVRVEIRYVPGGQGGGLGVGQFPGVPGAVGAVPGGIPGVTVPGAVPGVPGLAGAIPGVPDVLPAGGVASTEGGLLIETIDNMNALLVRYEDPGDLAELKSWIEQLDIPVLQVSIETKLVEVNESRAKEWLPEFNILNLEEADISGGILDARFANDADEFRSPFDPFPEDPRNAGLLKGRTVLNFLALGGETGLNFTLRALEAEGVLNMVNGPHVLVENGGTADFEISRRFGDLPTATSGGIGGIGGIGTTVGTFAEFLQVRMTVSPQITQLGEIRLDIQDLELSDFGNDLGTLTTIDIDGDGASEVFEPTAVARDASLNLETRTRRLTTVARVSNGGTIVLGGWTGERSRNSDSGVPILRNIPYVGKLLFGRTSDRVDRTNLLIFLTCNIVSP